MMFEKASVSCISLLVLGLQFLPQEIPARPIHIGSINTEAEADTRRFLPLAGYLAKQLEHEGVDEGKVVVARDIPQMASLLRAARVDLYIDSAFPSLAVSRLSGSKLVLRRWRRGVAEYYSVIFARKESEIRALEDLKGKMVAFEHPASTTGYFLPKMTLMARGLKMAHKTAVSDPVTRGEVGYTFSNDEENTMIWVLRAKVSAGAMDNENYLKQARQDINVLKIIAQTAPVPRQIVSFRGDLEPKLFHRIKDILVRMDRTEEGKRTLQFFESTTKFDEIDAASLKPVLRAYEVLRPELKFQ